MEKDAATRRREGIELERAARDAVNVGADSPLDLVAESIWDAVSDAVFASITSPEFAARLDHHGLALVPVCREVPEAPLAWSEDAIELMGYRSTVVDCLNHIHDLWKRAYTAGWQAAHASEAAVAPPLASGSYSTGGES